jgi:transcriptional regulator with XRE-family HTH domain
MTPPSNGDDTHIGLKIKKIRESHGFSKLELASRAGIDPSGLTRIEKGERDAHPDTLRKIEEALGIPVGSLRAAKTAGVQEGVRFAFPHTPLAAPMIALARSAFLPDVPSASFSRRSTEQPWWIPRESDKAMWPPLDDEIYPYVGSVLKNLLDEGAVDVIVAWGALVKWLPDTYQRVAQIAYGLSGCTAVGYTNRDKSTENCPEDLNSFFKTAADFYRGPNLTQKALPVVIPDGAQSLFMKYQDAVAKKFSSLKIDWDIHVVDFARWEDVEKEVQQRANPYILFLAWEPHLTRLSQGLQKTFKATEEKWIGSFSAEQRLPIYMSLDLIHRKDNPWIGQWLAQQRKKSDGLFGLLKAYCRQLPSAENPGGEPMIVKTIATHLRMEEDETELSLRRFVFDVRYYD